MESELRALPKTDLHCHLDGSLRVETALELAAGRKLKLPADTADELRPFLTVAPTCASLKEFLDVFQLIYPLLRDSSALERIAYELCEDCSAENIRHVEVRFAPLLQARSKFPPEEVIEAVLRGLSRGLADFEVTSGVIICLFRSHSARENAAAFRALKRFFKPGNGLSSPGVVGMDLAGDEARHPTMEFADFFDQARRLGIPATCHAGEVVGTENLKAAISLDVRRIGHGTHLFEDEQLLDEVIRRRVPLEVGITSNVRTKSVRSLRAHPVRRFFEAGVPITLNTDDRGIIGIDLTHEYRAAAELGFSFEELAGLSLASVDHLFLPEADRRRLRASFQAEIARLKKKPLRRP
ncbi:MAG: adenosine deaminase [Elusimicrobia bacterium]|nr:adenosine deaminase [Elusimicrobiota bacterium]